jgi:hypothetical protein
LSKALDEAAGCRSYPVYVPKGATTPLVWFRRSATSRERHLDDSAAVPVATFDVAVYADTYLEAKALADAIRLRVDNFAGMADGVNIQRCYLISESDGDPEFFRGEDVPTYSIDLVFEVRFTEVP